MRGGDARDGAYLPATAEGEKVSALTALSSAFSLSFWAGSLNRTEKKPGRREGGEREEARG